MGSAKNATKTANKAMQARLYRCNRHLSEINFEIIQPSYTNHLTVSSANNRGAG